MRTLILVLALGLWLPSRALPAAAEVTPPDSSFQEGLKHYQQGRFREAMASFEQADMAGESAPPVKLYLGMCRAELGESDAAQACFEEVIKSSPRDEALFLSLGQFWLEKNRPDLAAGLLRRGLRLNKDSEAALLKLTQAYEDLNLTESALATVERLLQLRPGDYEVGVKKAELLRRLGRYGEARAVAADLARADPVQMGAYEVLGRCPLSAASVLPAKPVELAASRPNLVLVSIDTLRADRLHCYGNSRETSPNIDAFARAGVFFERAISQSPHTSPSHMSILTGMMPDVHQVANFNKDQGIVLSPRISTLAEILNRNGYRTAAFVGKGNLPAGKGFSRGFDRYEASFDRDTDGDDPLPPGIAQELDEAVTGHRPFFLFLHHFFVHDPYIYGPEKFRSRFLVQGVKVEGLPTGYGDLAGLDKADRADAFWNAFDPGNPAHLRHLLALYDGGVLFSDYLFGRIIDLLEERKLYDDTIVVLFSDHGEEFFEHGNKGHMFLYVQELHVPLVIRFPGAALAGRRVAETVRTVDIFPTVLDRLGLSPGRVQGISMLPRLVGKAGYEPDIVSFSAIRSGGTVRVEVGGASYSNEPTERLYNLETDPAETDSIIADAPVKPLREELRETARRRQEEKAEFIDRIGSPIGGGPVEMTPEIEDDMRALGYL